MSERAIADPSQHGWTEVDGKWMWGGSGGGSGSIQDGDTEGQITTWDGTEWTPEGAVVVGADGNVVLGGQLSGLGMFRKDVGGVYFADSNVLPAGTDGWAADNVMSLGSEFNRFKDAHFSGDVHIAGRLFINGEEVTAGGGGASYTAGNGITIDGNTIKMSGSYSGTFTANTVVGSG